MNRRQKIIVSVTGIFLVLLILIGLTYAYFLTQISGNTNTKSISVSTANLALVYGDGNGIIAPEEEIIPGATLDSKTFTVKNNGNDTTEYVVVIEDVKVTTVSGTTTTFESNDFVYTLTCTSDGEACNGVDTEATFPINNGILIGNSVEVGKTHTYALTVTYKDTGIDQSADMNKILEAKVNIADPNSFNPYAGDKGSLAYTIINNAVTATSAEKEAGYAEYRAMPLTTPAVESTMLYTDNGLGTETSKTFTSTNSAKYYMTYGDSYKFIASTGTYTITNKDGSELKAVLLSTGYETLKGKYIVSYSGSTSTTAVSGSGKTTIYYVTDATISSGAVTIKYKPITKKTTEDSYRSAESTLTTTADEYGTSYYYRGDVENNYLNFNGMCWRIVRIEGDGAVKIVLADSSAECTIATQSKTDSAFIGTGDYGYDASYFADYENSQNRTSSMKYKFNIFLNGGSFTSYDSDYNEITKTYTAWSAEAKGKLKTTTACIGDTTTKYDDNGATLTDTAADELGYWNYNSYVRLYGKGQTANATLMCNATGGKTSETLIFPLTADEVVFAGGKTGTNNYTYYLRDNATSNYWWTLSPSYFSGNSDRAFYVGSYGYVYYNDYVANDDYSLRPAVSLASGAKIASGDGSISNPYTIQ